MPNLWILSRFEHDRTGLRFAGEAARSYGAAFEAQGLEVAHLDPLDAWFTAGGGVREIHLESGGFEIPPLTLVLTDPFRPDADLAFCRTLEGAGSACRNSSEALTAFSDPFEPFVRLSGAGQRIEAAARVRRPHCADDLIAEIGMPLDLSLPLHEGRHGRMRIADRGSLRGMLDHMWRSDLGAVAVKALEEGESEEWVPVACGKAFGGPEREALAAAKALSLDFGCFLVRGTGTEARIAGARPCPAPPGARISREVVEALALEFGKG